MRYAMRADTDPDACLTRIKGEALEAGAEHFRNELVEPSARNSGTVKIFTLGRFSIAINGEALREKGKAKHRPLGLLKTLIALGGRDVASSRLCEYLWPDSEADLAARSLTVTVHRLRSMLRENMVLIQHDGKLTLNEKICRIDIWDFERLVNAGLCKIGDSIAGDGAEMQLRAALALYAGDFLSRESEESWMLVPRLRLKTKFERLVLALSDRFERQKRHTETVDLNLQALGLDPLNELLYRRLMNSYLKRSEFSSVLRTYQRCREALTKGLAASASEETQRLYFEALRAASQSVAHVDTSSPRVQVRHQTMEKQSVV